MILVFLIPYSLGGICGPSLQALISKSILSDQQGELQGSLTSLVSVTSIIGPPIMTNLFYYFTHDQAPFEFSGAPFFLASILMFISSVVIYFSFKKDRGLNSLRINSPLISLANSNISGELLKIFF